MKLVDLSPAWFATGHDRIGMGLSFFCPRCYVAVGPAAHRLSVSFINPLDAHSPYPCGPYHERKGTDFALLTIIPSIREPRLVGDGPVHWQGHVLNGDIIDDTDLGGQPES